MIDRGTIDRIIQANPIESVVGEYVRLTKRGSNLVGLCPFHGEKTPSFNVNPARGIYKCFGCGKGGNAVSFLMELEQLSFIEAIRLLAKRANIELEEREESPEEQAQRTARESLMLLLQWAQAYYRRMLTESDEGRTVGLTYLQERGVLPETAAQFGIGYAPRSGHALLDEAQKAGYSIDHLLRAGLIIEGKDGHYDRFRERVLFPIQSESGRTLGFGGRVLRTDKNLAKYINSPESEIYHKSETLFGLPQAKRQIIKLDKCYLVEGYLDVISLHQRGLTNVVASSGTSLTGEQIRRIARFTKQVTLLYDGDSAGIKAAERGADMLLSEGITVRIVTLPSGQDPDDFAKAHPLPAIEAYLAENETDFIKFRTKLYLTEGGSDPITRANLATQILKSISQIPDPILRSLYVHETALAFQLDEGILAGQLDKQRATNLKVPKPAPPRVDSPAEQVPTKPEDSPAAQIPLGNLPIATCEREIIELLLIYGTQPMLASMSNAAEEDAEQTIAQYVAEELTFDELTLSIPLYAKVYDLYQSMSEGGTCDPLPQLLQHEDQTIAQLCIDLTTPTYTQSRMWKNNGEKLDIQALQHMASECILAYKSRLLDQEGHQLRQEMSRLYALGEDTTSIEESIQQHDKLRREFGKVTNRLKP